MATNASTRSSGLRTLCPECFGFGERTHPRARVRAGGEPVHGFDTRRCPTCRGREWLPGLAAPA